MQQQTRRQLPAAVSIAVVTEDDGVVDTVAAASAEFGVDVSIQSFETAVSAIDGIDGDRTDCVVCTETLEAGDGIEVATALREREPDLPIVLYTRADEERTVDDAFDAGVSELVDRDGEASERVLARNVRRLVVERPDVTRSEAHLQALADATSDAIVTIDADSTIRYVNSAVEAVFGYPPSDLLGEPLTVLMSDEMAEGHEVGIAEYLQTGERTLNWNYVELSGRHRDGRELQLAVSFSEFRYEGDRLFTGIVRDITEKTEHQRQLAAIAEISQELASAETQTEICDRVVNAIDARLNAPAALIAIYDDDGGLKTVAESPQKVGVDDALRADSSDDPLWQAFTTYEPVTSGVDGLAKRVDPAPRTGLCVPLGKYGVLTWTTADESLSDRERDMVRILAGNVRAALDRADREASLRSRTASLEEQTESLERAESLNTVLRDCIDVVIGGDSARDVHRSVCEQITAVDPFAFAWVGRHDSDDDELVPDASSGNGGGYLDEISVTVDDSPLSQGPAGRAFNTGSIQVQNDVVGDPPFEPWRQTALERGFRSVLAVPITLRDMQYCVLIVYATEARAFGTREREVFESLGGLIAFSLTADERKRALASGSAVELEFEVADDVEPVRLAAAVDAEIEFERFALEDNGVRASVRIADEIDDLRGTLADVASVRKTSIVSQNSEATRAEVLLDPNGFFGSLYDRSVLPRNGTADAHEVQLRVEIPEPVGLRSFVESLRRSHDDVTLLDRQDLDRSAHTQRAFRSMVEESLTDRQQEVLQTAYFGGFFEWPRDQTGQDIADSLGVSQPTVNRHLRAAERKLLTLFYEGE
jgi:PAS domain S-box-containing protein